MNSTSRPDQSVPTTWNRNAFDVTFGTNASFCEIVGTIFVRVSRFGVTSDATRMLVNGRPRPAFGSPGTDAPGW